jgi:hypothetical protein
MQLQTGNLYGEVTDPRGNPLPGTTVILSGNGSAPQVQVTNAQGQFRFLGLMPGTYNVKAELEGFATVNDPSVVIYLGRNTSLPITLQPAIGG